jgi:HEAT repeat protein
MSENDYQEIQALLESRDAEKLRQGLALVRQEISRVGAQEARPLFEMVTATFYIDPLDHPELVPILDEAVSLVVGFGEWVIPALISSLDAGDLKAQLAVGHALGRIGADAIEPLMAQYERLSEPACRTFVVYALGKIESPRVLQALPLVLNAAQSEDQELRDTATRALGKFAEAIPPSDLPEEQRQAVIDTLKTNLADTNAGIRAKAVRSLGKMAKVGHLDEAEQEQLREVCELVLGIDGSFDWDRAYIVRKEAKEALEHL